MPPVVLEQKSKNPIKVYITASITNFLWSPLKFVISWICFSLILVLGWKPMGKEILKAAKNIDRAVCIFPHTSYFDFVVMSLYRLAYPVVFADLWVVMKPQLFTSKLSPILRKLRFIKATKLEKSEKKYPMEAKTVAIKENKGFIASTADMMKSHKRYHIMISPEGRLLKSRWRSGYFWLAKNLECPIISIGICYYRRKMVMFEPIEPIDLSEPLKSSSSKTVDQEQTNNAEETKNKIQEILQKQFSDIIPLYPSQSWVNICYRGRNLSVVTWGNIKFKDIFYFTAMCPILYTLYLVCKTCNNFYVVIPYMWISMLALYISFRLYLKSTQQITHYDFKRFLNYISNCLVFYTIAIIIVFYLLPISFVYWVPTSYILNKVLAKIYLRYYQEYKRATRKDWNIPMAKWLWATGAVNNLALLVFNFVVMKYAQLVL